MMAEEGSKSSARRLDGILPTTSPKDAPEQASEPVCARHPSGDGDIRTIGAPIRGFIRSKSVSEEFLCLFVQLPPLVERLFQNILLNES